MRLRGLIKTAWTFFAPVLVGGTEIAMAAAGMGSVEVAAGKAAVTSVTAGVTELMTRLTARADREALATALAGQVKTQMTSPEKGAREDSLQSNYADDMIAARSDEPRASVDVDESSREAGRRDWQPSPQLAALQAQRDSLSNSLLGLKEAGASPKHIQSAQKAFLEFSSIAAEMEAAEKGGMEVSAESPPEPGPEAELEAEKGDASQVGELGEPPIENESLEASPGQEQSLAAGRGSAPAADVEGRASEQVLPGAEEPAPNQASAQKAEPFQQEAESSQPPERAPSPGPQASTLPAEATNQAEQTAADPPPAATPPQEARNEPRQQTMMPPQEGKAPQTENPNVEESAVPVGERNQAVTGEVQGSEGELDRDQRPGATGERKGDLQAEAAEDVKSASASGANQNQKAVSANEEAPQSKTGQAARPEGQPGGGERPEQASSQSDALNGPARKMAQLRAGATAPRAVDENGEALQGPARVAAQVPQVQASRSSHRGGHPPAPNHDPSRDSSRGGAE
jgi:hypothetical protein